MDHTIWSTWINFNTLNWFCSNQIKDRWSETAGEIGQWPVTETENKSTDQTVCSGDGKLKTLFSSLKQHLKSLRHFWVKSSPLKAPLREKPNNLPERKCRTFHWLRVAERSWPRSGETERSGRACRSLCRSGWKRCRTSARIPDRPCYESWCRDPCRPASVDIYCLAKRRSRTAVSASRPAAGWHWRSPYDTGCRRRSRLSGRNRSTRSLSGAARWTHDSSSSVSAWPVRSGCRCL